MANYIDTSLLFDNIITSFGMIDCGHVKSDYDRVVVSGKIPTTIIDKGYSFGDISPINIEIIGKGIFKVDSFEREITLMNNKSIKIEVNSNSGGEINIKSWCMKGGIPYEYSDPVLGTKTLRAESTLNLNAYGFAQNSLYIGAGIMLCEVYDIINGATTNRRLGVAMIPHGYNVGEEYPVAPYGLPFFQNDVMLLGFAPFATDVNQIEIDALYSFLEDTATLEWSYEDGDASDTWAGGGGDSPRNDAIGYSRLPTLSILNSGLVALYAPNTGQLRSVGEWLWSSNFFDNILKNFSSPFDNIIGLWISPRTPSTSSSTFKIGNIDSEIPINRVSGQYEHFTLGRVSIGKYYNSFADYENYRAFKLYIPYYGIVDISTDDIVGGWVEIGFNIDYLTGSGVAQVMTNRNGTPHVVHQYPVNIYASMPYSGQNMMSFYSQAVSASGQIMTGFSNNSLIGMTEGVLNLVSAHPTYGGSKSMGGLSGLLGIQRPYLIECRSIRDMPKKYNKYEGIPLNKFYEVKNLSGFTQFDSIRVGAINATDEEINEIENILKEGVIL